MRYNFGAANIVEWFYKSFGGYRELVCIQSGEVNFRTVYIESKEKSQRSLICYDFNFFELFLNKLLTRGVATAVTAVSIDETPGPV